MADPSPAQITIALAVILFLLFCLGAADIYHEHFSESSSEAQPLRATAVPVATTPVARDADLEQRLEQQVKEICSLERAVQGSSETISALERQLLSAQHAARQASDERDASRTEARSDLQKYVEDVEKRSKSYQGKLGELLNKQANADHRAGTAFKLAKAARQAQDFAQSKVAALEEEIRQLRDAKIPTQTSKSTQTVGGHAKNIVARLAAAEKKVRQQELEMKQKLKTATDGTDKERNLREAAEKQAKESQEIAAEIAANLGKKEEEHKQTKETLRGKEAALTSLEDEVDKEIEIHEKAMRTKAAELSGLENDLDAQKAENKKTAADLDATRKKNKRLHKKFNAKEAQRLTAVTMVTTANAIKENACTQARKMQRRAARLKKILAAQHKMKQKLETDVHSAKSYTDKLEGLLKDLEAQFEERVQFAVNKEVAAIQLAQMNILDRQEPPPLHDGQSTNNDNDDAMEVARSDEKTVIDSADATKSSQSSQENEFDAAMVDTPAPTIFQSGASNDVNTTAFPASQATEGMEWARQLQSEPQAGSSVMSQDTTTSMGPGSTNAIALPSTTVNGMNQDPVKIGDNPMKTTVVSPEPAMQTNQNATDAKDVSMTAAPGPSAPPTGSSAHTANTPAIVVKSTRALSTPLPGLKLNVAKVRRDSRNVLKARPAQATDQAKDDKRDLALKEAQTEIAKLKQLINTERNDMNKRIKQVRTETLYSRNELLQRQDYRMLLEQNQKLSEDAKNRANALQDIVDEQKKQLFKLETASPKQKGKEKETNNTQECKQCSSTKEKVAQFAIRFQLVEAAMDGKRVIAPRSAPNTDPHMIVFLFARSHIQLLLANKVIENLILKFGIKEEMPKSLRPLHSLGDVANKYAAEVKATWIEQVFRQFADEPIFYKENGQPHLNTSMWKYGRVMHYLLTKVAGAPVPVPIENMK